VPFPPSRHDEPKAPAPAVPGAIADASEIKTGDRVIYPAQGVCKVLGVEEKDIAGQKLALVKMQREEDGATVMVPKNKVASVGLRKLASADLMEGVFHYLAAVFDDPELDWKVRHRDNADRMVAGGVLGVAEVVKGLHALSRIRPLPTKEREQYDNARHLLVSEVSASLSVSECLAEDWIDYALMPPLGTKFDLKPPPTPVMVTSHRPKKKIIPFGEEELGIDELDLELGEEAEEKAEEGEEAAAGEGDAAEGGEAKAETGAAIPVPPAGKKKKEAKVKPPPVKVAEVLSKPVAKKEAKPKAASPAKKAAPVAKKAPAPAKPAAKKPAKPAGKKK
jgi:RNA polymerase-interacting CarD/CdnL/TRCF family regulator